MGGCGGGRAVPPAQPCAPGAHTEGADPQHPSCTPAVGSGPWLEPHLSTGVALRDPINPQQVFGTIKDEPSGSRTAPALFPGQAG